MANIDVRSYSGSRYNTGEPDPWKGVMDGPDLEVRKILLKHESGARLSDREYKRLANRMHLEADMTKRGGVVKQSITPRRMTPFEQGQQARQEDDDFAAGYEGRQAAGPASAAPATPRPTSPMTPPMSQEETADRVLRRRFGASPANRGQVDIATRRGSSTIPGPNAQPEGTPPAEGTADSLLRRRFGTPPNERGAVDVSTHVPRRRRDNNNSVLARRIY